MRSSRVNHRDRVLAHLDRSLRSAHQPDEDEESISNQLRSLLTQLPVTDREELLVSLSQSRRLFGLLRSCAADNNDVIDAGVVLLVELTSCVTRCAMRMIETHLMQVPVGGLVFRPKTN